MINANLIIKYLPKIQYSICEIVLEKEGFSTGFFCQIPFKKDNKLFLPVLITCNHSLPIDRKSTEEIKIILNGEKKTILLKNRKIWTDIYMDYTIIEINENEDNIHHFLILDDRIFENNCSNECYLNENIIIFAISKNNKEIAFSNGIIKKCYDYYFSYNSITFKGCSGGCIINQNNGKVIGFHKGATKKGDKDDFKVGIFLMDIIKQQKLSDIYNSKKESDLQKNTEKEQEPIQFYKSEEKEKKEEEEESKKEKERKQKEIKNEKELQKIKEKEERHKRIKEAIKKKALEDLKKQKLIEEQRIKESFEEKTKPK